MSKTQTLRGYLDSNLDIKELRNKCFIHKHTPNNEVYQIHNILKNSLEINVGFEIKLVKPIKYLEDEDCGLEFGKLCMGMQKAIHSLESGELDEDMFKFY